ncbi:tripartite tricarboxylate transporter family receptor [Variibacter gotjawalensis]|uniref:Tripartite tricarboxylate transporter family receptor n=1 Tax=Variibacter gotjawalensis TaxID=1333996 RepID=A0A0S3PU20_9BRAD|nr:tripartite tricarboxylate transporter substrate binding protein [Variibacter gotjawalensis]NIK49785.1 tripartite-type tricarboxylate transporter receptor subunit TctC [Variibacter gotjawalensis]RZS45789.1 tripartite-type tricarboxylate transporter receptor subunit TctC [Variibacter gotjawalensis]BAT59462.1 tripartite tricarboxylate transporter family receptor [Variibacter gotjawalensis]
MLRLLLFVGAFVVAVFGAPAFSQSSWPERNITLVVPFAAGGSSDITARLVAERLSKELGRTIVVENRAGAGGNIGAATVARATPDGYTLLLSTSTMAVNAALYKNMGFDLKADLVPISQLTTIPNVLIVAADFPAKSLAEFIEHTRRAKPQVTYGSAGVGTSQHMAAELFKKAAQIDWVHVPYKGGAQANNDLLAGHIQAVFAPMVEILPFIEAGKVRPLGVTTLQRSPRLPNVSTIDESLKGFEFQLWNGLFAPKGTPNDIIERLAAATRVALADPALSRQFNDQGTIIIGSSPREFATFLGEQIERMGALVRDSGARID